MATLSNLKPTDFMNEPNPTDLVTFEERYPKRENKILNSVLDTIGNTPLIRLNKIPQSYGLKCEILVKCEYFNPTGSIKDRIVQRMINDAEKQGRIKEGGILIEPSSGNTAISLGVIGNLRGYKTIVTVPDKNEGEKMTIMKALGMDIVKTATAVPWDSPESYFSIAYEMSAKTPGSITLNQYNNISNALSNFDQTGEEIVEACEGKVDFVSVGTGTGGTMTGICAKVKQKVPNCKVIGVDPDGSIIAQPPELNDKAGQGYKIEGMGHDFNPNTCVRKYVDTWVKSNDKVSFDLARRMVKEEGLFIGGSCGSALYGAIKYAQDNNLDERHRMVVILPDSSRNYLTKFLSDEWMVDHGYLELDTFVNPKSKLHGKTVSDLKPVSVRAHDKHVTLEEAIKMFTNGEDVIVLEEKGKVKGLIYEQDIITGLYSNNKKLSDTLGSITVKSVPVINFNTDLSIVSRLLEKHKVVIVEEKNAETQTSKLYKITPKDILTVSL